MLMHRPRVGRGHDVAATGAPERFIMIRLVIPQRSLCAKLASFALVVASLPSMALAEEVAARWDWSSGWFVKTSAGTNIIPGGDLTLDGVRYEAEFKNGLLVHGAVGRQWSEQWSTEIEFFYRRNKAESLTSPAGALAGGEIASTNVMFNVTYALPERWSVLAIRPYVGLGAGIMQEVDVDLVGFGSEEFSAKGDFIYQWLVGLQRRVGERGRLFVEGRAIAGGKPSLKSSTGPRRLVAEYDSWSLLAGFGWSF